jgi:hypothetical protein
MPGGPVRRSAAGCASPSPRECRALRQRALAAVAHHGLHHVGPVEGLETVARDQQALWCRPRLMR